MTARAERTFRRMPEVNRQMFEQGMTGTLFGRLYPLLEKLEEAFELVVIQDKIQQGKTEEEEEEEEEEKATALHEGEVTSWDGCSLLCLIGELDPLKHIDNVQRTLEKKFGQDEPESPMLRRLSTMSQSFGTRRGSTDRRRSSVMSSLDIRSNSRINLDVGKASMEEGVDEPKMAMRARMLELEKGPAGGSARRTSST